MALNGRERQVNSGDSNAKLGRREKRQGVCGKYGVD